MITRSTQFTAAALCFVISALSLPSHAAEATERLFPEDARLEARVTVLQGRVYLGELLEQLTEQSGVSLTVSTQQGPVDGIDLTVFIHAQPVSEVMQSLIELLSNRFNQWEWQRSASGDSSEYRLRPQRSPRAAARVAREALATRWFRDARSFYEIARMPEPDRSDAAAARPELFPDGRIASGKPDLLAALHPAEFEALLQGTQIGFDPRRLSAEGRSALGLGLSGPAPEVLGGTSTSPPPAFYIEWSAANTGPTLWVRNEMGVSGNVMGGLGWNRAWLQRESPGWLVQGDMEPQKLRTRLTDGDPSAGTRTSDGTLAHLLLRAARQQRLNVIADSVYPRQGSTWGSFWMGRNRDQTVQALVAFQGMMASQRGDIYLVRDRTALINPRAHLVPLRQIRQLRTACVGNGGQLGIPELVILTHLEPEQLAGLTEEFPDAERETIERWGPVIRFFEALTPPLRSRLQGAEGVRLIDAGRIARAHLAFAPGWVLIEPQAGRVRVRLRQEQGDGTSDTKARRLVWEIDVEDAPGQRHTLRLLPRMPLQPE
jgi:hypothetical protein